VLYSVRQGWRDPVKHAVQEVNSYPHRTNRPLTSDRPAAPNIEKWSLTNRRASAARNTPPPSAPAACDRLGVVQSMGRVASALDNAAAEAVNSILKTEYVYRHTFATREHARQAVGRWIDSWYNTTRRHGWCSGISPADYEEQHRRTSTADGQPAAA